MYPCAFEFSSVRFILYMKTDFCYEARYEHVFFSPVKNHLLIYLLIQAYLVDFLDCMLSCRFGNFLCNRYILFLTSPDATFVFEDPNVSLTRYFSRACIFDDIFLFLLFLGAKNVSYVSEFCSK